jgi:Ca2+-binding EF-hand superfamily protein
MQKEAMGILVKYLEVKEIKELRHAFLAIDKSRSGTLTYDEL